MLRSGGRQGAVGGRQEIGDYFIYSPHTPHPTPHTPEHTPPTPHTTHTNPPTTKTISGRRLRVRRQESGDYFYLFFLFPTPHTLHPTPHTPHPAPTKNFLPQTLVSVRGRVIR
ncbi:MAG: hypothetical protein EWV68_02910 [Microcystis sp. M_QC_C_20170808_M9Col]|nr:MAG: hypothetical protein EWV68_02910 [Microcystis sp. M_QC_C_20170808_M9Col]